MQPRVMQHVRIAVRCLRRIAGDRAGWRQRFGSNAIKINKSIFAMLVDDRYREAPPGGRGVDLFR